MSLSSISARVEFRFPTFQSETLSGPDKQNGSNVRQLTASRESESAADCTAWRRDLLHYTRRHTCTMKSVRGPRPAPGVAWRGLTLSLSPATALVFSSPSPSVPSNTSKTLVLFSRGCRFLWRSLTGSACVTHCIRLLERWCYYVSVCFCCL